MQIAYTIGLRGMRHLRQSSLQFWELPIMNYCFENKESSWTFTLLRSNQQFFVLFLAQFISLLHPSGGTLFILIASVQIRPHIDNDLIPLPLFDLNLTHSSIDIVNITSFKSVPALCRWSCWTRVTAEYRLFNAPSLITGDWPAEILSMVRR